MLAEDIALLPVPLAEDGIDVFLLDLTALPDSCALADRVLAARERQVYDRLTHPERRREWLGARVCLKAVVQRRHPALDPRHCEVVTAADGRPRLSFGTRSARGMLYDCSLSHAGRFACAAISSRAGVRIGVDVERVSPRLLRLEDAFAADRADGMASCRPEARLTVLWSLKEACAKATGGGIGAVLGSVVGERTASGWHRVRTVQGEDVRAWHVLYGEYAVAMCLSEPSKKGLRTCRES